MNICDKCSTHFLSSNEIWILRQRYLELLNTKGFLPGDNVLKKEEFSIIRKKLGKTQKQLAELLGMSLKTIHSYEQGWRTVPAYIERQLYFLTIHQRSNGKTLTPCWEQKSCTKKEQCPAWEFQSGHLCWFLCGTLCECANDTNAKDKLDVCKECDIFRSLTD